MGGLSSSPLRLTLASEVPSATRSYKVWYHRVSFVHFICPLARSPNAAWKPTFQNVVLHHHCVAKHIVQLKKIGGVSKCTCPPPRHAVCDIMMTKRLCLAPGLVSKITCATYRVDLLRVGPQFEETLTVSLASLDRRRHDLCSH